MKRKFLIIAILIFTLGANTSRIVLAEPKENISVSQSARLSPIAIYDEENLLKLSIEDVGKYHGDICLCALVAFRVTQFAISELWKPALHSEKEAGGDEIPRRGDFKIISALPTQGSQDCFEFITRVKTRKDFTLKLPQGTDNENLSRNNWSFTFMRKSNGRQIGIQVKEEVFPGGSRGFFNLRKKVKFDKTATKDENEIFISAKQKLKSIFINLSPEELFEFEK